MIHVTGHITIPDALLADLLSALRRHDAGDSERLLIAWAADRHTWSEDPYDDDVSIENDDPLTAWVWTEATAHVAERRFEHALCLLERYRRPFTRDDLAAFNPT